VRPMTVVLTLVAGLFSLSLVAAEDETFDQRLTEATQNRDSESGRKYGDAFSKDFGTQYASRLSECLKQTGDPAAKHTGTWLACAFARTESSGGAELDRQ
jgi:hypothetical protein